MEGERGDRDFAHDALIVVACVAAAAVFGACHDLIDVGISPDFYRIFKAAPPNGSIHLWAAWVGARAGGSAGLAAGILFCIAGDRGASPPAPAGHILRWVPLPLALAALGSFIGRALGGMYWPSFAARWSALEPYGLDQDGTHGVVIVNLMHAGVYAGGILGVLWACDGIRRSRLLKNNEGRHGGVPHTL